MGTFDSGGRHACGLQSQQGFSVPQVALLPYVARMMRKPPEHAVHTLPFPSSPRACCKAKILFSLKGFLGSDKYVKKKNHLNALDPSFVPDTE